MKIDVLISLKNIVLFCFLMCFIHAQAQVIIPDSSKSDMHYVKKKDVFDLLHCTTNKIGLTNKDLEEEESDTVVSNIFSFLPFINYTPPTSWAGGGLLS